MIYKYTKIVADSTTYIVKDVSNIDDIDDTDEVSHNVTELCTLDGETYIHVAGELPTLAEQISVEPVTLTDALKQQIKDASPHVKLIRARVVDKIREKYTLNDELKIMSLYFINPEDPLIQECSDYKESCRAWGRIEKAKIGL